MLYADDTCLVCSLQICTIYENVGFVYFQLQFLSNRGTIHYNETYCCMYREYTRATANQKRVTANYSTDNINYSLPCNLYLHYFNIACNSIDYLVYKMAFYIMPT